MAYFVDCIQTRKRPIPGLQEGKIVLEIVDAAYESSTTGKVVNLPVV